jgi:hypothetical protein
MMSPHRDTLLKARKVYSKSAGKVEKSIKDQGYTASLSHKVIGIGTAAEWLRRATEMDKICYMGEEWNKSKKHDLFLEILRFNFSWFALNAIFSREDLLSLFRKIPPEKKENEYSKFLLLYSNALSLNKIEYLEERSNKLHDLLAKETTTRLPYPNNSPVSTLEAIYLKYLPKPKKAVEEAVKAVKAGNVDSVEIPMLLYQFRNWSVHGNTLHGCFGSEPGFLEYVSLLQEILADVHYATATKLMSSL